MVLVAHDRVNLTIRESLDDRNSRKQHKAKAKAFLRLQSDKSAKYIANAVPFPPPS